MPSAKSTLLILLGVFAVGFCAVWLWELTRRRQWCWPTPFQALVGFIADFLDTFGIGSFATTTSLYRVRRTVADEKIPGTLNVGHTIPTVFQAFIFISKVEVEMTTLILLLGSSVLGAWLGAGVVSRLPRRRIQIGMGVALLVVVSLVVGQLLAIFPTGGESRGLDGLLLAVGVVACFLFGALMTIGIGAYAPILVTVSLLGMHVDTAFPIMMGACAFLMPVASERFVRTGAYDARAALGLTLAGVPAVLLASWLFFYLERVGQKLNLDVIKWIVVVVVIYTAVSMLRSAYVESRQKEATKA